MNRSASVVEMDSVTGTQHQKLAGSPDLIVHVIQKKLKTFHASKMYALQHGIYLLTPPLDWIVSPQDSDLPSVKRENSENGENRGSITSISP